jgi:hypothetical protein
MNSADLESGSPDEMLLPVAFCHTQPREQVMRGLHKRLANPADAAFVDVVVLGFDSEPMPQKYIQTTNRDSCDRQLVDESGTHPLYLALYTKVK